jgi:putative transcriptional regulator
MAIVRKSLSDLGAQPFVWTDEERARLEALSDADVDRAATGDPDAQSAKDNALDRAVLGRRLRRLRGKAGLDQVAFAEKYRIEADLLRDVEEGRVMPTSAFIAYLAVIEREPDAVMRALEAAASAV